MHLILAFGFNFFAWVPPLFGWIPVFLAAAIDFINNGAQNVGGSHVSLPGVGNLGVSLVLLALIIKLTFWKLNTAQFKAMLGMQKIAPRLKKLQERYKGDQAKMQAETANLYKESGVNPLAGCLPMLIQMPIIISVYWAVNAHKAIYEHTSFLWIGSSIAAQFPKFFAPSLAHADILLLVIYAATQYISMRFTSMPATDPAQAQQLKVMQAVSPLMIGWFGFHNAWPSAMVLYWLSFNAFTMGQQLYLMRKYHEPLSFIDSDHVITDDVIPQGVSTAALKGGSDTQKKSKKRSTKGA